jgi:hypothetical protein
LLPTKALNATALLAFVGAADLKGAGALSATPTMAFSAAANLIDGAFVPVEFIHIDVTAAVRGISITGQVGRFN